MGRESQTGGKGSDARPGREKAEAEAASGGATRLSPAGARIVAAFEEAIEVMRSGGPSAARLTARTYRADFATHDYGPDDVRRVRGLLGMSQALFAGFLGVDANTVRSWEQGNRPPSLIARRFLGEIESDPGYWKRRVSQSLTPAGAEGSTGD